MPPTAPSRQTLRHLTRLCYSTNTSRSINSRTPSFFQRTAVKAHSQPACSTHRTFSSTSHHRVQPSTTEPDSDPQNRATTTLPDITNFYTLFPSTIPDGPPGPSPKTQSDTTPSPSASSPRFEIHVPTLRKEFLRLQSLHHPDKYPTGSAAHQKALALSSLINNAYKTLSDPLLRAQYLLQLEYDIDVMSEDNAAHPTDQKTLMEVLEAQETIEEAGEDQIEEIKTENKQRIRETEMKIASAFEKGDVDAAKGETVRLKYWRSLQQGLDDWEPGKEVRLVH